MMDEKANAHIQPVTPAGHAESSKRYGFSPAVIAGGFIHVSGQVGIDRTTGKLPTDLATQIENTFDNLAEVLAAAGARLEDIVSLNSYHVGEMHQHMMAFIEARAKRLSGPYPAWTSVGVSQLALPELLVEVSALAAVRPG